VELWGNNHGHLWVHRRATSESQAKQGCHPCENGSSLPKTTVREYACGSHQGFKTGPQIRFGKSAMNALTVALTTLVLGRQRSSMIVGESYYKSCSLFWVSKPAFSMNATNNRPLHYELIDISKLSCYRIDRINAGDEKSAWPEQNTPGSSLRDSNMKRCHDLDVYPWFSLCITKSRERSVVSVQFLRKIIGSIFQVASNLKWHTS